MSDWRAKLSELRSELEMASPSAEQWISPEEQRRIDRELLEEEAARDAPRLREQSAQQRAAAVRAREELRLARENERKRLLDELTREGARAAPTTELGQRLTAARSEHDRAGEVLRKVSTRRDWLRSEASKTPIGSRDTPNWHALQDELANVRRLREEAQERFNASARRLATVESEVLHSERRQEEREIRERVLGPIKRATPLNWRVLPPGFLLKRRQELIGAGSRWEEELLERLEFLDSLGPLNWYEGSHLASTVYFVAEFEHVALADAREYGNAIYWVSHVRADWRYVFRLDKQEARKAGARRIIHTGDWEQRVRGLVRGGA